MKTILTNVKKEINDFYKFNQDAKNIFSDYIMLSDGKIVGKPIIDKGSHLIINPPFFNSNGSLPFICFSKQVFDNIKNNKKIIDNVILEDTTLSYFSSSTNECYEIGRICNKNDEKILLDNDYILRFNINKSRSWISLSDEEIINLVNNEIIEFDEGEYKTRISRELMPGLKKSNKVSITFEPDSRDIFKIIIMVQRATFVSFHIYSALYY